MKNTVGNINRKTGKMFLRSNPQRPVSTTSKINAFINGGNKAPEFKIMGGWLVQRTSQPGIWKRCCPASQVHISA